MTQHRCRNCGMWTAVILCGDCWRMVVAGVAATVIADVITRGITWLMK